MGEQSHIEDFFRKRLNSQEFVFQEEDWLKMERKLDLSGFSTHTAFVRSPVKLIIIILAGLTAAFILGWMANELVRKNKSSEILNNEGSYEIKPESDIPVANVPQPASGKNATINSPQPEKQGIPITHTGKAKPDPIYSSEVVTSNDSLNLAAAIQRPDSKSNEEELDTISRAPGKSEESSGSMIRLQFKKIDFLTGYNENLIAVPVDMVPESGASIRRPLSRLSIGLSIAPDFNSTGLMHSKSLSPAIGGVLTYAISPRWSVSARIFYNNKKYRSSGEYYNVSYDYWQNRTNGVVPDIIHGSCHVIDVPVLFNYAFLQKRFLSFTASAGIGSYFLLDEKYEFTFNNNNPRAATEWTTSENSQEFFNVVNLAMGLSLRTGARTSMLMEPYLKIPLKQMGWAKVNLSGMGLSFTFNYHF